MEEEEENHSVFYMKSSLWHGGSAWDAWFSCSSNQVAQVLLTLPYSFSQMVMVSGVVLQVFYGLLGRWTSYLISVHYIEYRSGKEKEGITNDQYFLQEHYMIENVYRWACGVSKHWYDVVELKRKRRIVSSMTLTGIVLRPGII